MRERSLWKACLGNSIKLGLFWYLHVSKRPSPIPEMKGFSRTNLLYMRAFASLTQMSKLSKQCLDKLPNITISPFGIRFKRLPLDRLYPRGVKSGTSWWELQGETRQAWQGKNLIPTRDPIVVQSGSDKFARSLFVRHHDVYSLPCQRSLHPAVWRRLRESGSSAIAFNH